MGVGLAISIVLLWSLFYKIDFRELFTVLKQANYYWLLPNMALVVFAMYLRAYRWRFMIAPVKQVAYSKLLAATFIGFMANNVLPLRLGEFVRAYSLSRQDRDITKSASLANIFVERMVFDLVALLLIFAVVLSFSNIPIDDQIRFGTTVAVAIALIGLLIMIVLALKPQQAGNLVVRYLFFLPAVIRENIRGIILKFSRGLEFLTDLKMVLSVGIQTIVLWIIMGVSNYFVFMAFDFPLPLTASFVLLVVVSISILIPSSPGFIGVYHAGAVWTLSVYGIGREDALSFALVLHAAQYIPITLMGFYYLKKEHLSLKKLEEEAVGEPDHSP
jgi:uncharacterized protein (TIRG00374 family)